MVVPEWGRRIEDGVLPGLPTH